MDVTSAPFNAKIINPLFSVQKSLLDQLACGAQPGDEKGTRLLTPHLVAIGIDAGSAYHSVAFPPYLKGTSYDQFDGIVNGHSEMVIE
jgi:hypothetical protein